MPTIKTTACTEEVKRLILYAGPESTYKMLRFIGVSKREANKITNGFFKSKKK